MTGSSKSIFGRRRRSVTPTHVYAMVNETYLGCILKILCRKCKRGMTIFVGYMWHCGGLLMLWHWATTMRWRSYSSMGVGHQYMINIIFGGNGSGRVLFHSHAVTITSNAIIYRHCYQMYKTVFVMLLGPRLLKCEHNLNPTFLIF